MLNAIGFKATKKLIADALYFPTIGTLKLHPQTGFADWDKDFPNPGDFYLLLDKNSIPPTNGLNFGAGRRPEDPERDREARRDPVEPADAVCVGVAGA